MPSFPYRILVEWSDDDDAFVARVPAVETVAAHGDTLEEATREAAAATMLLLESLRAHKRPLPASDVTADFAGKIALRVPRSMHATLARLASVEDVSINQLLVSLIASGLGRTGGKEANVDVFDDGAGFRRTPKAKASVMGSKPRVLQGTARAARAVHKHK